jgi:tetratricopeptide (TPR) repeat protein
MTGTAGDLADLERAATLLDLGRHADALPILDRFLATRPDVARAWCLKAQAQIALGDLSPALFSAQRAAGLEPDNSWAHQLASLVYSRQQCHVDALREAREAVRLAPWSWGALTTLARAHAMNPRTSDWSEALSAIERAREMAPLEPRVHVTAGTVEMAARHPQAAKEAFEKALSLDPQDPVAHHELARLQLRKTGGLAKAATGFATSIRSAPGDRTSEVGRRNLDLVVRIFLARAAYLLFVASFFAAGAFGSVSDKPESRLLPLGILLVPTLFVVWFVVRLTPELRRYLWRSLASPRGRLAAVVLELGAAGCIVAASIAPEPVRAGIGGAAFVLALIGRVCLMYASRHPSP